MTNSADPDQLICDLDLHCLLRQGMSCSAREGLKQLEAGFVDIRSPSLIPIDITTVEPQ